MRCTKNFLHRFGMSNTTLRNIPMDASTPPKPSKDNVDKAIGILKTLGGPLSPRIPFKQGGAADSYCDADYGEDTVTRKLLSGFAFILGRGSSVSWTSRLWPTVASSTTEANTWQTGWQQRKQSGSVCCLTILGTTK